MVYFVLLSVCLYVRCYSCDCLLIWQDLVSEYKKELKKKSVIEGLLVIFNIWILIIIMLKYCIVAYWFYGHYAVSTFKSLWLFKNIKLPLSGRLCVGAPPFFSFDFSCWPIFLFLFLLMCVVLLLPSLFFPFFTSLRRSYCPPWYGCRK